MHPTHPGAEFSVRAHMKAFVVEKYGESGLRAAQVLPPTIGPRDVLVRVRAAGINPLDKMVRDGEFKLLLQYKTPFVLGHDLAGVVTRIGAEVRDYAIGDEVYARPRDLRIGAFAEYIAIDHADIALKPRSLTMEESAAVPLVALAAWQALVEMAQIKSGQKVLVHAGAGGAQARKLGVRYSFFFMRADGAQLKTLAALYDAGNLRPVLDRIFQFDEILDAIAYLEQGRAKGKIVVTMPSIGAL